MSDHSLRKRLWELAWPAILANISSTLVNLVDMIMVGQLGSLAIASVGLGGQFSWFMMPLMFAISTGTLALVARFIGAKDFEKADLVLEQSVYLAFLMSIPVMLVGVFLGDDALRLMGASEEVIKLGYSYIKIFFLFYPVNFIAFSAFAALRGAGDTKTPMKLSIFLKLWSLMLSPLDAYLNGKSRIEVINLALE